MEISLFNVKITFQKNEVVTDDIGNHKNTWTDYYTCHATVSGEGGEKGKEYPAAGTTVETADMCFSVRCCALVDAISTTGYRILFQGEHYNILAIDHMNFKRKIYKFRCQKVRR